MKTKKLYLAAAILFAFAMSSCKKAELTTFYKVQIPTSSPIQAGNISGFVKGTLLAGQTYTVTADVTIKKGDTLSAQPGAIVTVKIMPSLTFRVY